MKKLYSCIRDINIKGEPNELLERITKFDQEIESLYKKTYELTNILLKFLNSHIGKQYEAATIAVFRMCSKQYAATICINDLQHQACKFIDKVNEYDLREQRYINPRRSNVEKIKVPDKVPVVNFDKDLAKNILQLLIKYSNSLELEYREIKRCKSDIEYLWRDSQSKDFFNEVDRYNLESTILNSLNPIKEFMQYLKDFV